MMKVVVVFLLAVAAVLMAPAPAAADVFCDNVKLLAETLPKNTSSSPLHFVTATVGQAPDVVYALALCRGDVVNNDTACAECVANIFGKILNDTPPPGAGEQCYAAYSFYGDCHVFYSSDNILAPSNATEQEKEEPFERWNVQVIPGDDAGRIVGLIHDLLVQTVQLAASTAPLRFATGAMDSGSSDFPTVHSLAQCTPDLPAGDCLACLQRLVGMIDSTMALRVGGQIHVMRCFFRYEAYPFYDGQPMLRINGSLLSPAPAPEPTTATKHNKSSKLWVIPVVVVPLAAAASLCFVLFYSPCFKRYRNKGKAMRLQAGSRRTQGEDELVLDGKNSDFSVFDFEQILDATDHFSEENKLGQGGFGAVYKGHFPDGPEMAIKRLASHSGQGFAEFRNEVQLIAKLQHRNLVRLLGCCSQEEEKILVYEYLPNKSLDFFIFDEDKRALMDLSKLLAIIEGIAHGLLYLHKHSRLRVIHRDLKPSNILLDSEMNPKISDFGLAKIFSSNNMEGNTTRRVVGTYGYMAPEYASEGIFSIKSDVFSFGVLVLEILSGKRNSGSHQCGNFINLIGYAWQLWEEGRWADLVDASLVPKSHSVEIMRCINIALLCVQENANDRPTMADVVAILSSETMILAEPKQPAYFNVRVGNEGASITATDSCSINYVTISVTTPR